MATRGDESVEVVVAPSGEDAAGHVPPIVPRIPCTMFWPALGVERQITAAWPLPLGSSATAGSNIAVPPLVKTVSVLSAPEGERETTCRQALAVPLHGAVLSLFTKTISALPAGSTASAGPPVLLVAVPSSVAAPQSEPAGRPATCTYWGGPLSTSIARTALPAASAPICGSGGWVVRPLTIGTCCWATQADPCANAGTTSRTSSVRASATGQGATRGRV